MHFSSHLAKSVFFISYWQGNREIKLNIQYHLQYIRIQAIEVLSCLGMLLTRTVYSGVKHTMYLIPRGGISP